jgi:hypothetical protein
MSNPVARELAEQHFAITAIRMSAHERAEARREILTRYWMRCYARQTIHHGIDSTKSPYSEVRS